MNHLHVINQLTKKLAEYNQPLVMAFTDYERAFDSVEAPAVTELLRSLEYLERQYLGKYLLNFHSYFASPQEK